MEPTNFTGGLFESLAASDDSQRVAHRKTLAVANKRVADRFGKFLAAAQGPSDHSARLDLIRADVREVVASVCNEHGGDPTRIERSIFSHLAGVEHTAPGKDHLPAASPKRNRQYEHIKEGCLEDGKSEDECKELAARTVNKQRAEKGETKNSKVAGGDWGTGAGGGQGDYADDPIDAPGDVLNPKAVDSINLEPNWEGMRAWVKEVAKTDPDTAKNINESMGREGLSPEELFGNAGPGSEEFEQPADGLQGPLPENDEDIYDEMLPPSHANVHTARRPKMCPYHKEVTDISLAAGDPSAGFNAMSQHAWGAQHCQGEFEGGCNFKPAMTTQTYWDEKAEKAQERRQERERQQQIEQEMQSVEVPDSPEGLESAPEAPVEDGLTEQLQDAPSAVGEGSEPQSQDMGSLEPMAASTKTAEEDESGVAHCDRCGREMTLDSGSDEEFCSQCKKATESKTAEALKTVDVDKGSADDPSPKMDKSQIPADGLGAPEGIEMEGSPHPTKTVDIMEPIKDFDSDFKDDIDSVTEKQKVDQDSSFDANKADSGSWAGNNNASPVTSAKVDPDVNPIRQILEEGFVPHSQVSSAIKNWETGS